MRSDSELFLKRIIEESKKQNKYDLFINLKDCVDIPGVEHNIKDILEDLKYNNCISSNYLIYTDNTIDLTLALDGINYFDEKENKNSQYDSKITINNITNIEGNNNSVENYNTTEQAFSFSSAEEIIKTIKKYDKYFDIEFGDNAERVRDILNESEKLANNHEKLNVIKKLFNELKQIVCGVAQNVITDVILKQLNGF